MQNSHITLRLRDTREFLGLTQQIVAAYVGVAPATLSQWERGRTYPSVEQLYLLSKCLGVTMESLIQYELRRI